MLESMLEDDVLILVVQQAACFFCRRGFFRCLWFIFSLTSSFRFYPRSFRLPCVPLLLSLNLLEPARGFNTVPCYKGHTPT